jgi:uncharacterized membrane protein YjgN (DUF898 family)
MAGKGIAQAAFWVAVVNVGLTVVVVGIYLVMFLIVGVSSI